MRVALLLTAAALGIVRVCEGAGPDPAQEKAMRADFYVAPDGKDTNPGTENQPFATLAGVREAVRRKTAAGLDHDIIVLLRGGPYEQASTLVFGPGDSGTEKHSITYAAYPGEKVVLSGGATVPRAGERRSWRKGEGEIWTAELPEAKGGRPTRPSSPIPRRTSRSALATTRPGTSAAC